MSQGAPPVQATVTLLNLIDIERDASCARNQPRSR